jgi:DNA replication protein DnaC
VLLHEELAKFRLYYLSENLDAFLDQNKNTEPRPLLERIVDLEGVEKTRRSTEARFKAARIGRFNNMAKFDWGWPREIDRSVIEDWLKGEFIGDHRNLIIAGPQGIGKTQIAKNIAYEAVMQGKKVLFRHLSLF